MESGQPGRRYLLGSHNLSYLEFMSKVADVVGCRTPRLPLPEWAHLCGAHRRVGSRFDVIALQA